MKRSVVRCVRACLGAVLFSAGVWAQADDGWCDVSANSSEAEGVTFGVEWIEDRRMVLVAHFHTFSSDAVVLFVQTVLADIAYDSIYLDFACTEDVAWDEPSPGTLFAEVLMARGPSASIMRLDERNGRAYDGEYVLQDDHMWSEHVPIVVRTGPGIGVSVGNLLEWLRTSGRVSYSTGVPVALGPGHSTTHFRPSREVASSAVAEAHALQHLRDRAR